MPHREVIIGQGTLALDIFKQCPDVGTVVVCTGGGGMLSGIAMAIKQLKVC
jgi:threonine dehydratase